MRPTTQPGTKAQERGAGPAVSERKGVGFLASDRAAYISGQVISINGGMA